MYINPVVVVGEGRGVHLYRAAAESVLTFSTLLWYSNMTTNDTVGEGCVHCKLLTCTSIHVTRMALTAQKLYTPVWGIVSFRSSFSKSFPSEKNNSRAGPLDKEQHLSHLSWSC